MDNLNNAGGLRTGMTPEEISAHASRTGVLTRYVGRVMFDSEWRGMPYAKTADIATYYVPTRGYPIVDGMCRVAMGPWLPYETYLQAWCFDDDDPYDVSGSLREELIRRRAEKRNK